MNPLRWPQRIICLSAESADICARLGAWDRVVGVTSYADQSGLDHRPVVSGFSRADAAKILTLQPDLIFTFSDVQADISAELIRGGATVVATNPRTLTEIANSIRLIGNAISLSDAAERLAHEFTLQSEDSFRAFKDVSHGPRVYFEEWPEPFITGIPWVAEIIEGLGAVDVFAHRRSPAARDRTVTADEIIAADPEIILASWCGRPVDVEAIRTRPGFEGISAVQNGQVFEIPSADILQPGPRLLRGIRRIGEIIEAWRQSRRGL